jgi:hypothetical protein
MRGAAPLAPGGLEPFPRAPSLSSVGPTPSAPFFSCIAHQTERNSSAIVAAEQAPTRRRSNATPVPQSFSASAPPPPLPSTASNCCSEQSFHGILKFPHRDCLPRTGQRSRLCSGAFRATRSKCRGLPQLGEARRAHPVRFCQPQRAPDATGDPRVGPSVAGLRPTASSPSDPCR